MGDAHRFTLMFSSSKNLAPNRKARQGHLALCAFVSLSVLMPMRVCLAAGNAPPHASIDRSGELAISSGMTLRVNTDLGNVHIQTFPPGSPSVLHYAVHVETDVTDPTGSGLLSGYSLIARQTPEGVLLNGALPNIHSLTVNRRFPSVRDAQFWVQFTITVPTNINVEVSTGVGDIETGDIGGRVILTTQGGNVTAGRIGFSGIPATSPEYRVAARIETGGGHITLKDVSGDVDAFTAGGHITAGNINGNAKLRSGGGHIRAKRIAGNAQVETEGGNITVGEAGSYVAVHTGGGQIDFGEVRGPVHAQNGGGGIRVMYVAGPMDVASTGGSICLTRVANTIHAQTSEGTITAWITPENPEQTRTVRLPGASQLASRTGDIVVFVPRNIAMTIDATVDAGGPGRIEADPALALNILSRPDGPVHAVANINGGGAPLKLHTAGGKIELQYIDAQPALRQSLEDAEKQRLADRLNELAANQASLSNFAAAPARVGPQALTGGSRDYWMDRFQLFFMGSVTEDEKEFKERLTSSPPPEYPAVARKAGVQGLVVLQVRMKMDGSLIVEKVVQGAPSLADAATAVVKNWRGTPLQIGGKHVEVVSTVSFNFTLQ
jgi:TonB family protein